MTHHRFHFQLGEFSPSLPSPSRSLKPGTLLSQLLLSNLQHQAKTTTPTITTATSLRGFTYNTTLCQDITKLHLNCGERKTATRAASDPEYRLSVPKLVLGTSLFVSLRTNPPTILPIFDYKTITPHRDYFYSAYDSSRAIHNRHHHDHESPFVDAVDSSVSPRTLNHDYFFRDASHSRRKAWQADRSNHHTWRPQRRVGLRDQDSPGRTARAATSVPRATTPWCPLSMAWVLQMEMEDVQQVSLFTFTTEMLHDGINVQVALARWSTTF